MPNVIADTNTVGVLTISSTENTMILAVLGISILGLAYAVFLMLQILREPKGSAKMQQVWGFIKTGANAYLGSQLRIIAVLIVVLTVVLFFSVAVVKPSTFAIQKFCPDIANKAAASLDVAAVTSVFKQTHPDASALDVQSEINSQTQAKIAQADLTGCNASLLVALGRGGAFLLGAIFAALVGYAGMNMAVQGNVRVAAAAVDKKRGYAEALRIAYRSGTITGMLTDGLGLFGGTIIFLIFGVASPDALLGFGFGATLLALFMRVGGGIFTKAADVGADLVGKVEADLPEDDPRNAAVIADLVGDNVGDCAGMAADIFQSYEVTIVSALILGLAVASATHSVIWIVFPLVVRGIGVFSSIVGTYFVRGSNQDKNAYSAIMRGFYTSAAVSIVLFILLTILYMKDGNGQIVWQPLAATVIGIGLAIVIERVTGFFTDLDHNPVKEIARNSLTGPATVILKGLSLGMESSTWSIFVIAGALMASLVIFTRFPLTGVDPFTAVLYGIAMTGIGMLTLTGNNVSMDAFGPISDNAQGVAELAGEAEDAGDTLELLDGVGNTTKAITKGVAIGSAVIAVVALFGSFMTDTQVAQLGLGIPSSQTLFAQGIRIEQPIVFIGMLIGGGLIFLFSSLLINSVNRAAFAMIEVVRRQLKIPGVREGTKTPDYAECVNISTQAAQRELLPLGVISVLAPIVVGFLLGAPALGGFLAGTILTGQLMAVFMANAGGAWDNAKKFIEQGNYGGKRSDPHKATVVGDTVGDPFKDTAGPALNPMIKVVNLVSLLAAPIIVTYSFYAQTNNGLTIAVVIVMLLLLAAIIWAVQRSKQGDPQQEAAQAALSASASSPAAGGDK